MPEELNLSDQASDPEVCRQYNGQEMCWLNCTVNVQQAKHSLCVNQSCLLSAPCVQVLSGKQSAINASIFHTQWLDTFPPALTYYFHCLLASIFVEWTSVILIICCSFVCDLSFLLAAFKSLSLSLMFCSFTTMCLGMEFFYFSYLVYVV